MATIKVQVDESGTRRVITKVVDGNRLVSCACCETVCCMYPADQLGVGYTADDLPDTIDVSGQIMGVPTRIIVSRNGSQYGPFNQSTSGGVTFTDTLLVDLNVSGNLAWLFNSDAIGDPCLFLADNSEQYVVDDTFEDFYTVEFLDGKQVVVNRETRCSWFGTATIDGFEYEASIGYNDQTFQWEAGFSTTDITSGVNPKDGNQNTPVGTYSGDNVITVSE